MFKLAEAMRAAAALVTGTTQYGSRIALAKQADRAANSFKALLHNSSIAAAMAKNVRAPAAMDRGPGRGTNALGESGAEVPGRQWVLFGKMFRGLSAGLHMRLDDSIRRLGEREASRFAAKHDHARASHIAASAWGRGGARTFDEVHVASPIGAITTGLAGIHSALVKTSANASQSYRGAALAQLVKGARALGDIFARLNLRQADRRDRAPLEFSRETRDSRGRRASDREPSVVQKKPSIPAGPLQAAETSAANRNLTRGGQRQSAVLGVRTNATNDSAIERLLETMAGLRHLLLARQRGAAMESADPLMQFRAFAPRRIDGNASREGNGTIGVTRARPAKAAVESGSAGARGGTAMQSFSQTVREWLGTVVREVQLRRLSMLRPEDAGPVSTTSFGSRRDAAHGADHNGRAAFLRLADRSSSSPEASGSHQRQLLGLGKQQVQLLERIDKALASRQPSVNDQARFAAGD